MSRYRRGDLVSVSFVLPAGYDAAPVATLMQGSTPIRTLDLTRIVPHTTTFVVAFRPGADLALATYSVSVAYSVSGTPANQSQSFTLVAGGDAEGPVISLFALDRPEATYVLALCGSGALVQGRNPEIP